MKRALLGTWPGRLVLSGVIVRIIDLLIARAAGTSTTLSIVDNIAGLAIAIGGAIFLARGLMFLRRHLLWRVRSKLIISYVFIGLVPAALIVAFFVLGVFLLFFNFGAYLVRSEFRTLNVQAQTIAHDVALEIERSAGRNAAAILARREADLAGDGAQVSVAMVRTHRECGDDPTAVQGTSDETQGLLGRAGPWRHMAPPTSIPAWIGCAGSSDTYVWSSDPSDFDAAARPTGRAGARSVPLRGGMPLVRAVALPGSSSPSYAIVVDLVFDDHLRRRLRDITGVELEDVSSIEREVEVMRGRPPDQPLRASADAPFFTSIAFLPARNWSDGTAGAMTTSVRLGIREMYQRISAAPGELGNARIVIVLLEVVGGLFLIIEIVALGTGSVLARSITGSVHELFAGTGRVRAGDFSHKIAVRADDQLGELAESFNTMTASIEDLLREAAEKKRLEEELRIAHEIQMSLLPQTPPRIPGLAMTALCVPAREVGGDYYDLLPIDDHRFGLVIADVSGKGTSAALYMAELKGLMLSLSRTHTSPRALLIEADRIMSTQLDARSFITISYAVIDMKARTMIFARAGHTPLIHVPDGAGSRTGRARVLVPNGLVLGLKIDEGQLFERLLEEQTIALQTGDLFAFFTDGITEAMNTAEDFFGEERLAHLLEEHADLPPDQLRERILRDVEAFVGDAPQHDDMTMILLKIEGEA